jgi:hypothetical protein
MRREAAGMRGWRHYLPPGMVLTAGDWYSANTLELLGEKQRGQKMEVVYFEDVFSRFAPHTR